MGLPPNRRPDSRVSGNDGGEQESGLSGLSMFESVLPLALLAGLWYALPQILRQQF